jgi:hypothetical protein
MMTFHVEKFAFTPYYRKYVLVELFLSFSSLCSEINFVLRYYKDMSGSSQTCH